MFKQAGFRWNGEGWEKNVPHPKFVELHERTTGAGFKVVADQLSGRHRATALKKQKEWKEKNNI